VPKRKIDWYGPKLRHFREQAGMTQAELGKRVGLVGSQINKLETNVNQPTLATALAIADSLGRSLDEFTHGRPPELQAEAKRPGGGKRKTK
jgi:transcriptional regulator with XRE-family HTH domain